MLSQCIVSSFAHIGCSLCNPCSTPFPSDLQGQLISRFYHLFPAYLQSPIVYSYNYSQPLHQCCTNVSDISKYGISAFAAEGSILIPSVSSLGFWVGTQAHQLCVYRLFVSLYYNVDGVAGAHGDLDIVHLIAPPRTHAHVHSKKTKQCRYFVFVCCSYGSPEEALK